jgi:hypothetical protein
MTQTNSYRVLQPSLSHLILSAWSLSSSLDLAPKTAQNAYNQAKLDVIKLHHCLVFARDTGVVV